MFLSDNKLQRENTKLRNIFKTVKEIISGGKNEIEIVGKVTENCTKQRNLIYLGEARQQHLVLCLQNLRRGRCKASILKEESRKGSLSDIWCG